MTNRATRAFITWLLRKPCTCTPTADGRYHLCDGNECWRHRAIEWLEGFMLFVEQGGRYVEGSLEPRPWRWHSCIAEFYGDPRCRADCPHRRMYRGS